MTAGEESAATDPAVTGPPAFCPSSVQGMRVRLYLLPLLIVVLLVGGWMFVYWLLHEDQDPRSLIRGMQEPGRRSWQRAYAFSQLLHDPAHDAMKDDVALHGELVALLARRNRQAAAGGIGGEEQEDARLRVYLCRAVGEFRLPQGLPILLDTAQSGTGPRQAAVRAAALEAIAVMAGTLGAGPILADPRAMNVVLKASLDAEGSDPQVAATAAYVLGVVGGARAVDRLIALLDDTREDVRYNAATGLARHGNLQALDVLLEMLDPQREAALLDERSRALRQRRQVLVIGNAVRAAERLHVMAPPPARQDLRAALQRVSTSPDTAAQVRLQATEAFLRLAKQP